MARTDTQRSDVLDAVVNRLIDQVPQCTDKTCFVSILPNPPYYPPDDQFVTVSPTAGRFVEELLDGGGQNQCTEDTGVLVSLFSRYVATQAGHDRDALNDFTRGILNLKRSVLKALVDFDLQFGGNLILRSLMQPTDAGPPEPITEGSGQGGRMVQVTLRFKTEFDWNLTA